MNPADRFMEAFPNAAESNGWSRKNLTDMVRDATRLGITGDEFQVIVDALRRKQRRMSVPSYAEVYTAMEARVRDRQGARVDSTVEKLRETRAAYVPPSEAHKAERKAWLAQFGNGGKQ